MIDLPEIIRKLASQGEAISALTQTFSDEQTTFKPGPETWALKDVMEHLYNEERMDFRRHLRGIFGEPSQPPKRVSVESARQGLDAFLAERQASVAWLKTLEAPDWDATTELRFGPSETMTISAEDMLVGWVEHDILHLRQIVELMHACNERQGSPLAVTYAGGW
jgi:uncharacterized damage-inducible protein DinB